MSQNIGKIENNDVRCVIYFFFDDGMSTFDFVVDIILLLDRKKFSCSFLLPIIRFDVVVNFVSLLCTHLPGCIMGIDW